MLPEWRNLVDARDLKSLGVYLCAGSSPAFGTIIFNEQLSMINDELIYNYTSSKLQNRVDAGTWNATATNGSECNL